jgi:dihydrofolate reductase
MINIIAAVGINREIGKNNQLLWDLPNDLKRFKSLTTGHPVIMGRKTHESIGKPLPGRLNIIITRQRDYFVDGCLIVHSIKDAIAEAKKQDEEVFIIGGEEIYKLAMPLAERLYMTWVHGEFEADSFFPEVDDQWYLATSENYTRDDRHKHDFVYTVHLKYE